MQWRWIGVREVGTVSVVVASVTVYLDLTSVSLPTVGVLTISVNLVGPILPFVRLVITPLVSLPLLRTAVT